MRAAVLLKSGGEELDVFDDIETLPLGPADVKIDIKATGVCHSDLHAINGDLPQGVPFVPGHEGAGVITEVGPAVTSLAVGDHVVIAWSPPCGQCVACVDQKSPHLCVMIQFAIAGLPKFKQGDTQIFGMAGTGTFSEEIVVPEQAAIKIDDDVPFEIASLIGCGVTTGVGAAINTAKVTPGSTCVVFGCGGVGISVIQGCRIAGAADIVAVDLNDEKQELAKRFGATASCSPDDLAALQGEVTGDAAASTTRSRRSVCPSRCGPHTTPFAAVAPPLWLVSATRARRSSSTCSSCSSWRRRSRAATTARPTCARTSSASLRLWKAGKLDLDGMITQKIGLDGVNEAIQQMKRGEVIRTVIEL